VWFIEYVVFTIYFDCGVGANKCACGTAGTIGVACFCGEVTAFIGLFREGNAALRAYCNTQAAALAAFGIDYYFASHRVYNCSSSRATCKDKRRLMSGIKAM
jgi:hypothetical protein